MPAVVPRCAELARAGGYLPAGTAASAPTFLLVEVPLPWPGAVTEHPLLEPVAPIADAHRARVQALVPDPAVAETPDGATRVVVYRRPDGPFRRYVRDERVIPTDRLAEGVEALLAPVSQAQATVPAGTGASSAGPDAGAAGGAGHSAQAGSDGGAGHFAQTASAGADGAPRAAPQIDVLVCTHGSRDACCGGAGSRVHQELAASALPGVRVWRTSHTGGHRFAPTAVTFPDGRAWASVDGPTLAAIVSRSLRPDEAVAHDRGCAAFADPFAQAAEGAVLEVEGWRWLDRPRTVDSVVVTDDRRTVTVTGHPTGNGVGAGAGEGDSVVYRAEVVVQRVVPVPDCGRPLSEARKSSQELVVVSLTRR